MENGRVNTFREEICNICIDSCTILDVYDIWTSANEFIFGCNDWKRAYEPAVSNGSLHNLIWAGIAHYELRV